MEKAAESEDGGLKAMKQLTRVALERRLARAERENFMLRHWIDFPESREWAPHDWVARLKSEGLLARSTYHLDAGAVNDLCRHLWSVRRTMR